MPHGGKLVDLFADDKAAAKAGVSHTIELTDRQSCDVQLLCNGGFSPLTGFMSESEYDSVVDNMRLTNNLIFGLPVVMDTDDDSIKEGSKILLTYKGTDMAVLDVSSKWTPDKPKECLAAYGTATIEHPGVRMVAMERGRSYIGGDVVGLDTPTRDFPCETPAEVRAKLPAGVDVVAFQCRNPVHRAHYELFTRALHAQNVSENAVVLVHPTCGPTQQDDIPGSVRFQTYERLAAEVDNASIRWAYLPYAMHMAGPREALQHMIIRRNYGCTHFIIGRDMAGCKSSLSGDDFYGPYDAQNFAKECAPELTMETVPSLNLVFTDEEGYVTAEHAEARGLHVKKLSGTQFRKMLRSGEEIPEWFAFRSVVEVLRAS